MTDWFHARPPSTLYKFKAYSTLLDRKRVRRMLTRGEVYFARAPEFNDPFELKPQWVSRGKDSAELQRIFREEALKDVRGGNRNQRRARVKAALKNATPEKIRQNQNDYHKLLETNVDIFCMSGTRENLLMWAHYGQSHTGLCIHIDATRMPFVVADQVDYSDSYPSILVPAEDSQEAFRVCLLRKGTDWKSEDEYRLFHLRLPGCSSLGLSWNKQIATVPLNAFTGVTLGARMPPVYRRTFVQLAGRAPHPFEVWIAKPSDAAFTLEFDRLA